LREIADLLEREVCFNGAADHHRQCASGVHGDLASPCPGIRSACVVHVESLMGGSHAYT
jgi:hypothetical protein